MDLDNPPTSSSNQIREKRKLANDQKLMLSSSDKMMYNLGQDNNATVSSGFGSSKNHNNILQSSTPGVESPFILFNSKHMADKNAMAAKLKLTIPGTNSVNPLAFNAASNALAATQQLQTGRRTSSLKASYEAINAGFNHFNFLPGIDEDDEMGSSSFLRQSSEHNDFEQANKKARLSNKKNRATNQYNLNANNVSTNEMGNELWTTSTNDESRYCHCQNISYGEMIFCENPEVICLPSTCLLVITIFYKRLSILQCPNGQWFHYECVGINKPPKGSWFCPVCIANGNRKSNKDKNKKKLSMNL